MALGSSARVALRMVRAASSSATLFSALTVEKRLHRVSDERLDRYVRAWARGLLRVIDVRVVLDPEGPAPRDVLPPAARLVVSNHRSTVDILLMLELFGGQLLARGDMAGWPVVGELARAAGTLFVDRADPSSGAAAVQRLRDRLRAGRTVGVFPEGTTFVGDEVRTFHAGAFVAIAREKGVVHPMGIAYDGDRANYGDEPVSAHFQRLLESPFTRVAVAIGEPIASRGLTVTALRDRAQASVQALVHRARARLG